MCPPVRFPAQDPWEAVGAVINRQIDSAAMAACPNAPPILFLAAQKRESQFFYVFPPPQETGTPRKNTALGTQSGIGRKENAPRPVEEKKALGALRHLRASARDGGRRIGACSDFAWPSSTL